MTRTQFIALPVVIVALCWLAIVPFLLWPEPWSFIWHRLLDLAEAM
jgi:hypothetical protein